MATRSILLDEAGAGTMSRGLKQDMVPEPTVGDVYITDRKWKDLTGDALKQTPDSAIDEELFNLQQEERFSAEISQPQMKEEILGWWHGTIVAIRGKTFTAKMVDLDGRESVAELERRAAGHAQQGDIRISARFIYSVSREDGPDGAITKSSLQFIPPVIWCTKDEEYTEKRLKELYTD